jgi:hypothetical protein
VRQAFVIERYAIHKKSGTRSCEIAYGITSRPPDEADPEECSPPTVVTGASKTATTILDWNYTMKTGVGYAPDTVYPSITA